MAEAVVVWAGDEQRGMCRWRVEGDGADPSSCRPSWLADCAVRVEPLDVVMQLQGRRWCRTASRAMPTAQNRRVEAVRALVQSAQRPRLWRMRGRGRGAESREQRGGGCISKEGTAQQPQIAIPTSAHHNTGLSTASHHITSHRCQSSPHAVSAAQLLISFTPACTTQPLPTPSPFHSTPLLTPPHPAMSTSTPSFKWAEDSERIFLTIELQSATDVNVQLQPTRFTFSAKSGTPPTSYSLDFELPKSIEPSKSSWSVKGRQVEVVLVKAEDSEGWWHSLLKDKSQYKGRVKIDWDLWRDEDEEKALPDDFGGMGGGGMGGMGGGGGMVSA